MNQPIKVKGVVIGHLVDGDFVPLQPTAPTVPPAPEGEALDKLIDDCCHWIEQSVGTFKKRLAPELQPDNDGRSSLTLAEGKNRWGGSAGHGGVKSWIVDGNIRSPEQIRKPINDFLDAMAQRVRVKRHIDPNWKLDNDAMAVLSSRFGIKDAPKTFDELYALKEERRLGAERQQAERDAEFKRRNAEWQASPEGLAFAEKMRVDEFKREQVKIVMDALFPLERIEYADPENPTEEEKIANKPKRFHNDDMWSCRREWEPRVREVINKTNLAAHSVVRIFQDAEEDYHEVSEYLSEEQIINDAKGKFIMATLAATAKASLEGNPAPLTQSSVPPVIPGVERVHGATVKDLVEAMEKFWAQGMVMYHHHDFEGRVLTAVPPALRDTWERHSREWDEMLKEQV